MLLDSAFARALGVARDAPPEIVASYLLRQANRDPVDVPPPVAAWLVRLGAELALSIGENKTVDVDAVAKATANEWGPKLPRWLAPSALAVLAPHQVLPAHQAGEHAKVGRALLMRHLPWFCKAVLRTWQDDGHLPAEEIGDDYESEEYKRLVGQWGA